MHIDKQFQCVLYILMVTITSCVPVSTQSYDSSSGSKQITYANAVYEQDIKTVQLYPSRNNRIELTQPAVISLDQATPLILSFDHLYHDIEDFRVKLIHCNADWQPSNFQNLDILENYNEFRIENYQQSFNTRVPYIHYTFKCPKVKIPGNYMVVVYRGNNQDDLILTQRMMVFDNLVGIAPGIGPSSNVSLRTFNQQIDFSVSYGKLNVTNALQEIKAVIRQNKRWDNAIVGLKPSFIKEFEKVLDYEYYNLSNNFQGGNEFRFFDLRSPNFEGQNVASLETTEDKITVNLMWDKSRQGEAYASRKDLNGNYIVDKVDSDHPELDADYAYVNFFLEAPNKINGNLYVLGEMNDWKHNMENMMIYNQELKAYIGRQYLKLGWYNYIYYADKSQNQDPYYFEGSHYQTENQYEIFIYFREIGGRGDILAGYTSFRANGR